MAQGTEASRRPQLQSVPLHCFCEDALKGIGKRIPVDAKQLDFASRARAEQVVKGN